MALELVSVMTAFEVMKIVRFGCAMFYCQPKDRYIIIRAPVGTAAKEVHERREATWLAI